MVPSEAVHIVGVTVAVTIISFIVTVVVHMFELPQASVAFHVIVDIPTPKFPLASAPVPVLVVAPVME
jgi:hypothetical protein